MMVAVRFDFVGAVFIYNRRRRKTRAELVTVGQSGDLPISRTVDEPCGAGSRDRAWCGPKDRYGQEHHGRGAPGGDGSRRLVCAASEIGRRPWRELVEGGGGASTDRPRLCQ